MRFLDKCKLLMVPILALVLVNCTGKNDGKVSFSSQNDIGTNATATKASTKKVSRSNKVKAVNRRDKPAKAVGFEYGPNIFENYDILDDIDHIALGDVSTPTMLLTLFQTAPNFDIGYKLCLAANRQNDDSCYYSLGYDNIGYGLCMAAGRDENECMHALGSANTGFGMCMSNPLNSFNDCDDALGATNIGFGICMAQDVQNGSYNPYDCYDALTYASDNTGYGICIAAGFGYNTCSEALSDLNSGYGLCMASMNNNYPSTASDNCYLALANQHDSENIGFGLCMAGNDYKNTLNLCEPSLGHNNLGFGLCSSAQRDNFNFWGDYNCDVALYDSYYNPANNVGYGICMAAGRPQNQCDDLVVENARKVGAADNENIGAGICLSNTSNYDNDCDEVIGKDATGYGLCMAAGKSYYDCSPSIGSDNAGFGICMTHRSYYDCQSGLDYSNETGLGLDSNIGYGICMSNTANQDNDCYSSTTGGASIGFGVCMKIYKDFNRCYRTLDYDSVGYAACLADPESSNSSYLSGDTNIEGICYEYASENPKAKYMITQGSTTEEILNKKISRNAFTYIDLDFNVPTLDANQKADVFVVARYKDYSGRETWYQKNGYTWNIWDGTFQHLFADHSNYKLKSTTDIMPIYSGNLHDLPGYFRLYWGYRIKGDPIDAVNYNAFKHFDLEVTY